MLERNRSVLSLFQFLERTNRLSIREQDDCVPILFAFRREHNRSVDMFSIYLLIRERNGTERQSPENVTATRL